MRARLSDVAREAGVSTATVDRVLNNRAGVHARTREVVLGAAYRLGYTVDAPVSAVAARPVRLDFVLPAGSASFMTLLGRQIEIQAARLHGINAKLHLIEGFNPDRLVQKLLELQGRADGVALVALDHPTVREAIRSLAGSGVKVLTLVSDIHHVPRIAYIGVDNRSTGRLAGYLTGRLLGGGPHKVAMLAGSLSYRGHEEREMGFRHILAESFPALEILELTEMRDDSDKAFEAVMGLLERHPDLGGLYNIGAGNRGVAQALEQAGVAGRVVFVGHDLTQHTKAALLAGTMDAVIDQNPRVEAREALSVLADAVRGQAWHTHPLRIQVIFRENIPEE